jgi:hypothetical protein
VTHTPGPSRHHGVFPHADRGVVTGRGWVARECDATGRAADQYHYAGVMPVRVYLTRYAAEARADVLTSGAIASDA